MKKILTILFALAMALGTSMGQDELSYEVNVPATRLVKDTSYTWWLLYDNFKHDVKFKDELPEDFDFNSLSVNDNINLNLLVEYINEANEMILLTTGLYNLNAWANENYNYDIWMPEKVVYVILFLLDTKNNKWVGGSMDTVVLAPAMLVKLENIYSPYVYKSWPKFKKKITVNTCFKVCLYDPDRKQRSTFSYSYGAMQKLKSISSQDNN